MLHVNDELEDGKTVDLELFFVMKLVRSVAHAHCFNCLGASAAMYEERLINGLLVDAGGSSKPKAC